MTETPIPAPIQKYGVRWNITKGGPIDSEGGKCKRTSGDSPGFPVIVTDTDGEDTEEVSYFHTTYEWDSVNLSFNALEETGNKPLIGYTVTATIFSYQEETERPGGPSVTDPGDLEPEEPVKTVTIQYIDSTVTSMSIVSEDPNDGNTWVFPDDYPELIVDRNHPKQYGGVVLYASPPVFVPANFSVEAGIDDGPNDDGVIVWETRSGNKQTLISGYNYIDVFDKADFSYTPRNSNDDQQIQNNDRFRLSPYYPDVKDPFDLAAPIYPMNMVNSFVPDGRDAVDVYYTVIVTASQQREGDLIPIPLENGSITIKQTCTQDSGNYSEQLDALLSYCNWSNPQDLPTEELSPYYPYMYPYTLINGFEGLGLGREPKTRGDETDRAPLERGDVWYNPETEERYYWSVSDIPESLKIVEEGKRYRTKENVPCVWEPKDTCNPLKDRVNVPFGLLVNTTCENGKVVKVSISDQSQPKYFQDGDEVVISGGNGQARLKINIKEPERWVKTYVSHV